MPLKLGRRGLQRGVAALLALLIVVFAVATFAGGPAGSDGAAIPSASPVISPGPSGTQTRAPAASASTAPKATSQAVGYSPPPPATPTPSPDPGSWRWEGVVVDQRGNPVAGACVAVGPQGCLPSSTRTDARGVWFIDFPQAAVDYELHFSKPGFATYDVRITPTSAWTFNVVLKG